MNVTEIVKKWVDASIPNNGFVVKDVNETNINHWTTLYSSDAPSPHKPELHIRYDGGSVNIQPLYDSAYVGKYGSAVNSRITNYLEVLQEKYMEEFGILVTYTTPTLFTSYASSDCFVTADALCSHGPPSSCENSTISESGNITLKELHHTNIWNIAARIGESTSSDTVKMVFLGQKVCERGTSQCQTVQYAGKAFPSIDLAAVLYNGNVTQELLTTIHEFGHMYGVIDHYGGTESAGVTTETLALEHPEREYSPYCIYGEKKFTDSSVNSNIVICNGCKSWIIENRNQYSN